MCRYYFILLIGAIFTQTAFCECLPIGLLGEFNTTTNKTSVVFGREIKAGVDIAKGELGNCYSIVEIDINNNIANISDLIKENVLKKINIFIGLGTTEQVLAAINGINGTGAILVSPTATSDTIYEKSSNIITMSPLNSQIVKSITKELKKRKLNKVLTIYSADDQYSKSMKELMEKDKVTHIKSVGLYLGKGADLRELSKINIDQFDVVFLPLFEHEVLKVMAYFKRENKKVKFIGSDSWGTHSKIIKTLPADQKESILFTVSLFPVFMKKLQQSIFYRTYLKRFNVEPTDLSAFSYDALLAVNSSYDCLLKDAKNINCFKGNFQSSLGDIINLKANRVERNVFIKDKL